MRAINHRKSPDLPLYEQIAGQVAALVEKGTFRPGDRVPSIRDLSRQFRVSLNTVKEAYALLEDRRLGIWDRVIQSATPRSAMYGGHLTFSFLLGLGQILVVFLIFNLGFGVSLGQNYPGVLAIIAAYTLAVVALGLFLAGLVRNAQQMSVVIPIVAVSSAMLGGAYWPLEIVSNQVLLTLSRFVPIRYALDGLKGIIYYDYAWPELLPLIGMLLAFAAVFMLLGLLLIDRRRAR